MATLTSEWTIEAVKWDEILKKYKFPNKQLQKYKNMWIQWAQYYTYYMYNRLKQHYVLPRTALKYMSKWDYNKDKLPKETIIPELWKAEWLQLRPQQQKLIDDIWDLKFALLKAKTWFGKSYVIAWLIKKFKIKTLIVVPKIEIAKWLYQKFLSMYGDNVSIFNWTKPKITPIMIIVWASFRKYWEDLNWKFDMLIFDEAHMDMFWKERIKALCYMQYTRLYWLTATPERKEIDSKYFENIYWPIIEAETEKRVEPTILYKQYNSFIDEWWDYWAELLQQLVDDDDRIIDMAYTIIETMSLSTRHMWIIFVDRVEMAEKINIILQAVWFPSYTYTSKTQNRDEILKEMEEKRWVIVATYQTVWVGFDYGALDTGFFYMNIKFQWTVKQAVWRILRKNTEDHKPILIDWQDNVRSLKSQSRERLKAYKQTFSTTTILPYNSVMLWINNISRLNMTVEEYFGKAQLAMKNYKKQKEETWKSN